MSKFSSRKLETDLAFTEWLLEQIELYPWTYRKFSKGKLESIKEKLEAKLKDYYDFISDS